MNAPCLCLPEPDRDRGLVLSAGIAALLVHLTALVWLPLPAAPEPEARPPRVPTFEVGETRLPPPPPPSRPATALPAADRRRPVPMPPEAVPAVEPVAEPPARAESTSPTARFEDAVGWQAAPPPLPERIREGTTGLRPPVLLPGRAEPVYPPLAIKTRLGGRVVLRAVITREGAVSEIEVLEAPQFDAGFVQAAMDAVSSWRYTPGRYRGEAVEVEMRVVVEFSLE